MLFILSRFIFGGIVFTICCFLLNRSRVKRYRYFISIILATILLTLSALIPFENALITFSSVQTAYKYSNTYDVKLVVPGQKSDFVIGGNSEDENIISVIPKSNNGWKTGIGFNMKKAKQKIFDKVWIHIYRYKNSDDFYISILDINGSKSEISDNHNSNFYKLSITEKN